MEQASITAHLKQLASCNASQRTAAAQTLTDAVMTREESVHAIVAAEGVSVLAQALHAPEPDVQRFTATVLVHAAQAGYDKQVAESGAFKRLVQLTSSTHPEVLRSATAVLSMCSDMDRPKFRSSGALRRLVELLDHSTPRVQMLAATGMGKLGFKRPMEVVEAGAVPGLVRLLSQRNTGEEVHQAAPRSCMDTA